ncbi:hypothetical protein NXY25_27285 [Bacteroides thetaiotaomicron]|nr:hypothetical protein [Bacteroides thetaiotaomicron]
MQKEWEESLANLNLSKLKQDINWEVVFGDMSKVAKKQLQQVKKQLQDFKKSPEFKKCYSGTDQSDGGSFEQHK